MNRKTVINVDLDDAVDSVSEKLKDDPLLAIQASDEDVAIFSDPNVEALISAAEGNLDPVTIDDRTKELIERDIIDQMSKELQRSGEIDAQLYKNQVNSSTFDSMYQKATKRRLIEIERKIDGLGTKILNAAKLQTAEGELTESEQNEINSLDTYREQYVTALVEREYIQNTSESPDYMLKSSIDIDQIAQNTQKQYDAIENAQKRRSFNERARTRAASMKQNRSQSAPASVTVSTQTVEEPKTTVIADDVIRSKVEEIARKQGIDTNSGLLDTATNLVKTDIEVTVNHVKKSLEKLYKHYLPNRPPKKVQDGAAGIIIDETSQLAEATVDLLANGTPSAQDVNDLIEQANWHINPNNASGQRGDYENAPTEHIVAMLETLKPSVYSETLEKTVQIRKLVEEAKKELLQEQKNELIDNIDLSTTKKEAQKEVKAGKIHTRDMFGQKGTYDRSSRVTHATIPPAPPSKKRKRTLSDRLSVKKQKSESIRENKPPKQAKQGLKSKSLLRWAKDAARDIGKIKKQATKAARGIKSTVRKLGKS